MGCDGGTIPKRNELVKTKQKPETKDKDSELAFQWQYCAITQEMLQPPIVACGLGRLYSKVALIEALINRSILPDTASHIRSLKDVKDLVLTPNPAYVKGQEKTEGSADNRSVPYICPVIGLEMSGKFKFVALWSCGCVFSERALKEIKTETCHKCLKPFCQEDVLILNGNAEDVELMKQRMEKRQLATKKKKDKKNKVAENSTVTSQAIKEEPGTSTSTTSTFTAGPSKPKDASSVKLLSNKRPGSLVAQEEPNLKKAKASYSVAKDPKVTDVYKSLFTSHKSEKEQTRAHWITYNPFYN